MAELSTSLIVRGESIQSLYTQFRAGNLLVNRRYQRKLVWAVEEKQAFIDSLRQEMPVPLILVAERRDAEGVLKLEIIDGLQRLNAVFSFIENEYQADGGYFDLATLAETKALADGGDLMQSMPTLDRADCVALANYNLPISVYRTERESKVEEVFRRINSNGRHLSRQEIRQAGCLSNFADLVRVTSATIRRDYSVSDAVDLRGMPEISISSVPTGPGVFVDRVFWVQHRILDREQVRQSRDEEIVADLLSSMLIDPLPPYDSRVLDEFYGLLESSESRADRIETAIVQRGPDAVRAQFQTVFEAFNAIFPADTHVFTAVFFETEKRRVPRYFEAVFLGLYRLLISEDRELAEISAIREKLAGYGNRHIDIPGGGGTWTARSKRENADVIASAIRDYTIERQDAPDPLSERLNLQLLALLRASRVETSLFELKQGFSILNQEPALSDATVEEVVRTAAAIANGGFGTTGYILIGVTEDEATAARVSSMTGEAICEVDGRYITGLTLDVALAGTLDKLLLWLTDKIRSYGLEAAFEVPLLREMRVARVAGRDVLMLKVRAASHPVAVGDAFFVRVGSQTVQLRPAELSRVFTRFRPADAG